MSDMSRMTVKDDDIFAQPNNTVSPLQGIALCCSRTCPKPATPERSFGRLVPNISNAENSPEGGISLGPWNGLPEPTPSRLANIRVRRANNGSTLLQSPARAGHTARMRQIFEDAGREHQSSQLEQGVSYPQLPNISRKASPPLEHGRTEQHHPPRSFRLVSHTTQVDSPRVSEQSSESWSDDSGYFIAGSRNRTSSLASQPRDRVNDWLTNVSLCEQEPIVVENTLDYQPTRPPSPQSPPPRQTEIDVFPKPTRQPPQEASATFQDPFLDTNPPLRTSPLFKALPPRRPPTHPQTHSPCNVTIRSNPFQTKRPMLQDGGIQLSPLSPNVCVERGPSRYHSTRTSPVKERRMMRYLANENDNGGVALEERKGRDVGGAEAQGSPLAPCKIGVGTRFQHARHGVRGLARFGRCLES